MAHSRGRDTRMQKQWNNIGATELAITASSTNLGGSLAVLVPSTVIRMMGEYLLHFTGGATIVAGDVCRVTVGIGLFSSDAVDAGAGSLPDPADESEYPWLFWKQHELAALTADPAQVQDGIGVVRQAFDVRSQRKMKPRETLAYVVQYVDVSGAPPVSARMAAVRCLLAT